MDVCCGSSIECGDKSMKNLYLKVVAVIGVTCLSVWFIPGVDDLSLIHISEPTRPY